MPGIFKKHFTATTRAISGVSRVAGKLATVAIAATLALTAGQASAERQVRKFNLDGISRSYIVHLPDNMSSSKTYRVLMAWHPGGATSRWMENNSEFHERAAAKDYVVVYPNGYRLTFNAGNCCGQARERDLDDVKFFKTIMADLKTIAPVESRAYVTGFSNGAMMNFRLMCEVPDMIAAAAPFGGVTPMTNCKSGTPPSVMYIAGEQDTGAVSGGTRELSKRFDSSSATLSPPTPALDFIAQRGGCSLSSKNTKRFDAIDSTCTTYTSCSSGREVMMCVIPRLGHRWPGAEAPRVNVTKTDLGDVRPELNGAGAILAFFNNH